MPVEKMDQLWPGGYRFFFDDTLFQPGTDSFLLGAFPRLKPRLRVCDLGAGTGLLGLLLLAREPSLLVTNVELQSAAVELARRNAQLNELSVTCLQADLRDSAQLPQAGSFDLVISNPPYFPVSAGDSGGPARCEETCTLDELCACAARLVRNGGRFALCHRPERLADLMCTLRKYNMEPKRMKLLSHSPDHAPFLVLLECVRLGRPGLEIVP